jgi:hypothetical protein
MNVHDLLPVTQAMYQQMNAIAWLMLAPMFLLSCVIEYVREPHAFPALLMLKKLVVTAVLLCLFPQITSLISTISNDLAVKISEKGALDALYTQLREQTLPKNQLTKFPFLLGADMNVSFLNYLSYGVAHLAKPLMILLFHVLWSLNLIIGPLIILCNVFRSATHVTGHLFRSIFEISCWNIVWAILGEMLLGLQFINQQKPANYFDSIGFNFFLTLAMVGTPIFVHILVSQGLSSTSGITAAGTATLVSAPMTASKLMRKPFQNTSREEK